MANSHVAATDCDAAISWNSHELPGGMITGGHGTDSAACVVPSSGMPASCGDASPKRNRYWSPMTLMTVRRMPWLRRRTAADAAVAVMAPTYMVAMLVASLPMFGLTGVMAVP